MDVNGTRFHLLFGQRDWLRAPSRRSPPRDHPQLEWNAADQTLRLRRLQPVLRPGSGVASAAADARLGATADRYGNWYWIAADGTAIRTLARDGTSAQPFWPPPPALPGPTAGDFTPASPSVLPEMYRGLAATCDHYLVVGTVQPPGLLIFDLYGGGDPLPLRWPGSFAPFDLAAGDDGRLWILDRVNRSVWALDRSFRIAPRPGGTPVPPPDFAPAPGGVSGPVPPVPPRAPIALAASADPVAVEAVAGDVYLILDNGQSSAHSVVQCYRGTDLVGQAALDHDAAIAFDTAEPIRLQVRGGDMAFVPQAPDASGNRGGTLYVASDDGRQSFAYAVTVGSGFNLALSGRLLPMRRYSGEGLARIGDRVTYAFGGRWSTLVDQPQPRFAPAGTVILPAWQGRRFDGKEPGCVWHRLLLDAAIPPDADVVVESRAADDAASLARLPWQVEPRLYLRSDGAEVPYYRPPLPGDAAHRGTWELLFQHAKGRYLQLRLRVAGHGRATPVLQALRVHYPRFSYLREYLPAVYREDAVSASLLDRFLENPEGTFTALEGRLEALQALFDARTAPPELLAWLASWVGLSLDAGWDEATRRLFLANAPTLFRERGTCAGLLRAIRIALEGCADPSLFAPATCTAGGTTGFGVRLVERFRLRRAPGVAFGDPNDVLGPGSSSDATAWTPAQGAEPLHRRFRDFVAARYASIAECNAAWGTTFASFADVVLPAVDPGCGARTADWRAFVLGAIGFGYAPATDGDEPLYREFLARRYPQPSDVNAAYGLSGNGRLRTFADVWARLWDAQLRHRLPAGGPMLRDWVLFVTTVLPTHRNAHRFIVLVPVTPDDSLAVQAHKRAVADRAAAINRPAHTAHEVRLYWGLFRAGEARVGFDTVTGPGSRSVALTLDRDILGTAHLGFTDAQRSRARFTLDQPLGAGSAAAGCGRAGDD